MRVIVEAALERDGFVLLCADHGNAECMIAQDGTPMTAHTANPVPLIAVNSGAKGLRDGRLCDIVPTMLALCGLQKPPEMTGESLLRDDVSGQELF